MLPLSMTRAEAICKSSYTAAEPPTQHTSSLILYLTNQSVSLRSMSWKCRFPSHSSTESVLFHKRLYKLWRDSPGKP